MDDYIDRIVSYRIDICAIFMPGPPPIAAFAIHRFVFKIFLWIQAVITELYHFLFSIIWFDVIYVATKAALNKRGSGWEQQHICNWIDKIRFESVQLRIQRMKQKREYRKQNRTEQQKKLIKQ